MAIHFIWKLKPVIYSLLWRIEFKSCWKFPIKNMKNSNLLWCIWISRNTLKWPKCRASRSIWMIWMVSEVFLNTWCRVQILLVKSGLRRSYQRFEVLPSNRIRRAMRMWFKKIKFRLCDLSLFVRLINRWERGGKEE